MADKFKDKISEQLNDFKLQPSPTVWQEVDAALHPKRQKRLLIWWLLPLLGLLVGGFWYLVVSEQQENKVQGMNEQGSEEQKSKNQENKIQGNKEKGSKEQENKLQENKAQENKNQGSRIEANKEQESKAKENQQQGVKRMAFKNKKTDIGDNKYRIDIEPEKLIVANKANKIKQTDFTPFANKEIEKLSKIIVTEPVTKAIAKDKIEAEVISKNIDTIATVTKPKDTATITEDSNKTIAKTFADTSLQRNAMVKSIPKKHQWFFMVGGGFLNTPLSNNYRSLAANGAFLASSLPPVGVTNREALPQPINGINVKIGLQNVTTLSKHWQLETGLQYVYLQNNLMLQNDTAAIFPNGYVAGNNFSITNKAHLLQVPVSLGYSFNATAKNKFSILFGGSLAWAFSQQWLIADNANSRLYYDQSLNNKLLLGLHSGIVFNQNNHFKIAVLTDYSITPIHKNTTDKFHFLQYTLQISTPIIFNKQSSIKK